MNRMLTLFALGLLTFASGCFMSIGPGGSSPSAQAKAKKIQENRAKRQSSDENESGVMLVVNGASASPEELWATSREELAEKVAVATPQELATFIQRKTRQLVADKVAELLLFQEAKLRQPKGMVENIESYVDADIRRVVTTRHGGIQRRFEKHLATLGRTLEDERDRLRRQTTVQAYLEMELKPKLQEPTRPELLSAFEERKDSLRTPPRRSMSLIDVRVIDHLPSGVTDPTRDQQQEARATARAIADTAHAELSSGVSFGEVARRHSDGLHADDGGAWGWISPGSVRERFEPAVTALYTISPDSFSQVLEVSDGFFIVRCDELDPGFVPDFESLQPQMRSELMQSNYQSLIANLVETLERKADIKPNPIEKLHLAVYDTGLKLAGLGGD
jgi:parvulin-like peptidyl-prolyl isomerase